MVKSEKREYHYIYKTTCTVTYKFYIGMHSTDNLLDGYQGSGKLLLRSINKYGKENHNTEILESCSDRNTLAKREMEIVNEELLLDPLCINLKIGGQGGFDKHTEESKTKISIANKDRILSEETKRKMSLANKDKKLSEDHKKKISVANKGKKLTQETKTKISTTHKARILTEEDRAKIGSFHKGKKLSEETKRKIDESGKETLKFRNRRIVIINGIEYQSVSSAISALGLKYYGLLRKMIDSTDLKYIGIYYKDSPKYQDGYQKFGLVE